MFGLNEHGRHPDTAYRQRIVDKAFTIALDEIETAHVFLRERHIGDAVSIGHNVTIHGAKICDGALVGMGAVVLDHAVVGEGAIVAAGSVVLSRTVIGAGELWGGTPAKFIKKVDPEQSKELNQKIARNYLMYSGWYEEKE